VSAPGAGPGGLDGAAPGPGRGVVVSWSAGVGWDGLLWAQHGDGIAVALDPEGLIRDVRWSLVPADLVDLDPEDDEGYAALNKDDARTWALDRLDDAGLSKTTLAKIRKALEP
jgi:hypothetical protein